MFHTGIRMNDKWNKNKIKKNFISFFFFLAKETYAAIEIWKYENIIQICSLVLALLSISNEKLSFL